MSIKSFHPPVRTLMGPGPSDVNPRILEAMSRPTIGHLDPAFVSMMDEMKDLLRYAFQTSNDLTMPVSAPVSGGCHFHPRCPSAMPQCQQQYPPETGADDHRVRCFLHA